MCIQQALQAMHPQGIYSLIYVSSLHKKKNAHLQLVVSLTREIVTRNCQVRALIHEQTLWHETKCPIDTDRWEAFGTAFSTQMNCVTQFRATAVGLLLAKECCCKFL